MQRERWLPVVGYEDRYEVSDLGRVRSLDHFTRGRSNSQRLIRGRVLRLTPTKSGHLTTHLGRRSGTQLVHALVLAAFVGPRPPGLDIRHRNGIPTDNRLENLTYGTRSENLFDCVAHGNHFQANKTHCKNGHEFTPANTYMQRGKYRGCRACKNADDRRRYQRNRAA